MSKTLKQIQADIDNIANSLETLSVNQVIELMKQALKELNKVKLEEDNEG